MQVVAQNQGNARANVYLHTPQVHKTKELCAHLCTYTQPKYTNTRNYARICVHTPHPSPQNRDNARAGNALATKLALEAHCASNLSEFPLRVAFARVMLRSSRSSRNTPTPPRGKCSINWMMQLQTPEKYTANVPKTSQSSDKRPVILRRMLHKLVGVATKAG